MDVAGPVTVQEIMVVLRRWQVRLLAGEAGVSRPITWASTMRARLPAFEGLQGGELALLALPVLRALHAQGISLSLADVVEQLDELGVSAIAIGGIADDASLAPGERQALAEAAALAEERGMPLLALASATLNEVEHDLIAHLMTRRARQPQSAEPSAADAARLRAGLRSEALETLLTGTYASEAAMRTRAFQLGYDLTQPHAVLWIDLAPHADLPPHALGPRGADPTAIHLADELAVALGAWARPHEMQVAALAPLAGAEHGLTSLIERAKAVLARALNAADGDWAAGISARHGAPGAADCGTAPHRAFQRPGGVSVIAGAPRERPACAVCGAHPGAAAGGYAQWLASDRDAGSVLRLQRQSF